MGSMELSKPEGACSAGRLWLRWETVVHVQAVAATGTIENMENIQLKHGLQQQRLTVTLLCDAANSMP